MPREQMVQVASRLFYEQGVRATGVAEVIAAAGCGKQALYRLFPSKDELVAAHLEMVAAQRERRAEDVISSAANPADQLIALTTDLATWVGRPEFRGCALRNYLHECPTVDSKAKEVAEEYLRSSREQVERLAAAARPEDGTQLARKVWLIHEGLYGDLHPTPQTRAAAVAMVSDLVALPADTG